MSLFSFFYYIFAVIIYIIALPYLIYKSKSTKYKVAIPSKFFLKNNASFEEEKIWFHSCSMGETIALKPLLNEFKDSNISVITNTGFSEASKHSKNVRYLPFEIFLPFWIRKQKALVVMEAELWYMLFFIAKKKGAKTFLINARISDKSFKSYLKFKWFYKKIFANIDKVFAQSQKDKQRLQLLGAKNIQVIGNIKLAQLPKITKEYKKCDNKTIITAASSHKNEEKLVLDSYKKEFGRLIIVPRHPERFDEVYSLVENFSNENNLTCHRFSKKQSLDSDIIVVDKMGELNNIYAVSDVVILCGAFEKIGGHNPVEPAFFNTKIISGKNIFNQKALFECIENYYLIDNNSLKEYLEKIDTLKASKLNEVGDIKPIIKELNEIR